MERNTEEQEFRKIFTYVEIRYPGVAPSALRIAAYWQHLKDLPMAAIRLGAERAVRGSPAIMPSAEVWRRAAEATARTVAITHARALPEPELSEEQRLRNLREAQKIIEGLSTAMAVDDEDGL